MHTTEAKLLIVDDEPNIRELLSASLRFAGFHVSSAASGSEAAEAVARDRPDLVVLDVMLPDMDGFTVLRRLRDQSAAPPKDAAHDRIPVILLTAKDSADDKISGLKAGSDDYVTKPFSLEELIARIRAILRRTSGPAADNRLVVADLELDRIGHQALRAGRPAFLSPTEFRLLEYLMSNTGRVVSKVQILDHVWAYDFGGDLSIVESYISYLRRKIDSGADGSPKLIHTLRGIGYVLRPPAA
ncbi:two-component system OmpR family response regulator [Streptacidiphilus sp. MAP12-16]|uniref:response regulator transcription factor n=1 Tax=Streptacidiphilus sp. MAP12-16 TaxID=3156300 RepID=UPI0035121A10